MLIEKSLGTVVCGEPFLTETEVALMLLRAILEQKDPKVQALLIEKLGKGPSGVLVADCIARLSQLGLTVQVPEKSQVTSTQNSRRALLHRTNRTLQ